MHVFIFNILQCNYKHDLIHKNDFSGWCHNVTMLWLGWIFLLSSQLFLYIFSLLLDCQDNKYLNRNDLNFEGTFHLVRVRVIHIEEWQHVRPAKLIPKVSKNDTAYSQHCLHRTWAPSILDVTTNILHIECRGCFVFLSLWLYSLFFFFLLLRWRAVTQTNHVFIVNHTITLQGFWKTPFTVS